MRTAKEIRTEAKDRRAAYQRFQDWDVPDLVEELDDLRHQELPEIKKWADQLVDQVDKCLQIGIIGGNHWPTKLSSKEIWALARKKVKVSHHLKIQRVDIDMSDFEDYPIVDIRFEYDSQFICPYFHLEELRELFDFEKATKATIGFENRCQGPVISFVGTYDSRFCHIHILLTKER